MFYANTFSARLHTSPDDLTSLSEWCHIWNFSANEEKCSVLHFTTGHFPVMCNYSMNSKDLGLIVSANLWWQPHYHPITPKAYKMVCFAEFFQVPCPYWLNAACIHPLYALSWSIVQSFGIHTCWWILSVWNSFKEKQQNLSWRVLQWIIKIVWCTYISYR